ncbi:MAG: hypothetical protein FJ399_22015 [Verrucomicrobia bacterium]|nr:hypothetical protein [Verrucomicrobiota bacterium]
MLLRADLSAQEAEQIPSGILAKNSSKFSGSVTAPPGILAKNSSKFRIASYSEVAVADAYVALLTPKRAFYAVDGKAGLTRTDSEGRFDFGDFALPPGREVLVEVFGPTGDSLIDYAVSAEGSNVSQVSLATTLVTRFAIEQANAKGKSLAAFDRRRLVDLAGGTRGALERGDLRVDGAVFDFGKRKALLRAYQAVIKGDLLASWRAFLGFDPVDIPPDAANPAEATQGQTAGAVGSAL